MGCSDGAQWEKQGLNQHHNQANSARQARIRCSYLVTENKLEKCAGFRANDFSVSAGKHFSCKAQRALSFVTIATGFRSVSHHIRHTTGSPSADVRCQYLDQYVRVLLRSVEHRHNRGTKHQDYPPGGGQE